VADLRVDIASEFTGKAAFTKAQKATGSLDKAVGKLGKQMDALAAAAGEADKRKDYAGTQRILEEWSKVRSIYNRIAAGSDYAEVGKFTKRLPNFEANYQKSGKKLPIQRQSVKRDKTLTYNPKTGKLEE
jgi:hypothetical protein